mgnify:CR=1 FL=1
MILDYKNAETWDSVISAKLTEVLGSSYPERIKENSEKILYRDCDWEGCDLFIKTASRELIRASIVDALKISFKEVLAYHACRPTRIDDYYEKGIMPLSPESAQKQFREYFSSHASEEEIKQAIKSVRLDTRDYVTHVVLDDRGFIDTCGHYLIYGGEYQNCLTINLPGASEHTRDILKQFGKATVFICCLSFALVAELECLASSMIADHFFRLAHKRESVWDIDYTITIEDTIPPEAIVGHYCPEKIKDPYKNNAIWNEISMNYE